MPMQYMPSFGPIIYDTYGRVVRQGVPTPIPQPVPTAPQRTMGPPVGVTAAQGGYNQPRQAAPMPVAPPAGVPAAAGGMPAQQRTLGGLLGLDEERFSDNALSMGLLGLGGQLLAAGGPQQMPVGLGQAFGQGVGGFMQGMQAGQQMDEQERARVLEKQRKEQEAAYIATLPPEMQALAKAGGMGAVQKAQAEGKGAFSGPQTPSNMYEMAAQLYPGDAKAQAEWVSAQQERGRASVSITNTTGETAGKTLLTNALEKTTSLSESGYAAASALADYREMRSLLEMGLTTGAGQETVGQFRSLALGFGYELPEGQVSQQAMQEAFNSISTRIILPQVKQLGVNPTDADLKFVQQATPGLSKSVEGNKVMLDLLELKAQRDIALAQFTDEYWTKTAQGGMDQGQAAAGFRQALSQFMSSSPLFSRTAVASLRARFNQANRPGGAPAPSGGGGNALIDNGLVTE